MHCLVIDDDPLVCETVVGWLQQIGGVEYCLQANEGVTALNLISTGDFSLIFLDLDIPGLDGESLLRSIARTLPVIVITADPSFGAKSYDYQVIDYLVKPLSFPRFFQAIEKARERHQPVREEKSIEKPPEEDGFLFVKDGNRIVKVQLDQVLCVKAEANYVSIMLPDQSVMTLLSMKRLEETLPSNFIRTHRSWIVNVARIQKIEDGVVVVGTQKVPIGDSYREQLMSRLKLLS